MDVTSNTVNLWIAKAYIAKNDEGLLDSKVFETIMMNWIELFVLQQVGTVHLKN